MIQTATDLLAPAQSKISVKPKDISSPIGFAKALEAEGLRLEEQPAQPVVVMELPIEIEPDIAHFPSSIFELLGEEEDVEEFVDVEKIVAPVPTLAPELNVIAYIAYSSPAPENENKDEPVEREHKHKNFSPLDVKHVPLENREIEIAPTLEEDEENPEFPQKEQPANIDTKRDEPANVSEPVARNVEQRAEPVAHSELPPPLRGTPLRERSTARLQKVSASLSEGGGAEESSPLPPEAAVPPLRGGLKTTLTRAVLQPPSEREVAPQATEGGRVAPQGEREKPEPLEREEALEKMPPEPHKREAAFSDFLTNIAEARTAPKPEGISQQAPAPRAQHTYQLLNTGRAAFTESLESVVRFARSEGIDRATLIVNPPALGKISVEIISTTKGVEASLKVSSEQVRALVQDQIVQLKQALAQIGVQTAEFSVDVQQQDKQNEQAWQNQNLKNRRNNADKEDETQDDEEVFRVDLRKGLLHWVA